MATSTGSVQREVLTYLQVHGPQRSHELSDHFVVEAAMNISPVLDELTSRGHIVAMKLDRATILTVTKSGLNLL